MTAELLIESAQGETRSALIEDGAPAEIRLHRDRPVVAGAIHLARVQRAAEAQGGAFLDLGQEIAGFLPVRRGRMPDEGSSLLVQVRAPAVEGGKAAKLGTTIRLGGRYAVLAEGSGIAGTAPAKLADALEGIAREASVVLRPAAALAPEDSVVAEAARLLGRLRMLQAAAGAPRQLLAAPSPLERLLRDAPPGLAAVHISGSGLKAEAMHLIARMPDLEGRLEEWQEAVPLFEARGVEDVLDRIAAGLLPLPSGGRLAIEETRAATVIDIDSGATAGGSARRIADIEAAATLGRLLRLADIGGLVLADFIDLPARRERAAVLAALDDALARDPAPVRRSGLDCHGVLSLTRRREGLSLRQLLLTRTSPRLNAESRMLALLRSAERLARATPGPGGLVLPADPEVTALLEARDLHTRLSERCGRAVRLEPAAAAGQDRQVPRVEMS